jgi:processive 1,2-diacylglycerol beta-glucosyltransferase
MTEPPRILIVTAAFGEGHNSAAKNLGIALTSLGCLTRVADPCLLGSPGLTWLLSLGYRIVTTRMPGLWAMIYRSTDRCDFRRRRSPIMRLPERALGELIDDFQPSVLVCTYPLYPYFLKRIPQGIRHDIPVITAVTDSIEINAAWLRSPSDAFLVSDEGTRDAMEQWGIPAGRLVTTGFPVNPAFAKLKSIPADDPCETFRVLYFPTANPVLLTKHGRALLDASPKVRLTIILGRSVRRLARRAKRLKKQYPGRVRLIGWTKRVPHYLSRHHLTVGKAGGATVHEAIAARCPMLIHHLVPGQEEGNLSLLESIGGGSLANTPQTLGRRVGELLARDAAGWRAMKQALIDHDRNDGAEQAARFIMNQIPPSP